MTTTATTADPTALTLPRATFAKVSPDAFLTAHLLASDRSAAVRRPNGRLPYDFRPPTCNAGSLTHCVGSAVVRTGDTAVVCGIQAEILLAKNIAAPPHLTAASPSQTPDEIASLNLLVPNVELATGCCPAHLPGSGGPPSSEAQTLSQRIFHLLLSSRLVDVEDLRIQYKPCNLGLVDSEAKEPRDLPETVAYWTLYPSIHVLSLSGTNGLFDAAWASLVAALQDVRLPCSWWDPDLEYVVCSDRKSEAKKLSLRGSPMASTWGVFIVDKNAIGSSQDKQTSRSGVKHTESGSQVWFLADPDSFEEPLCKEFVTVVVDCSDTKAKIVKIEKSGGDKVGTEDMKKLLREAEKRWIEWNEVVT